MISYDHKLIEKSLTQLWNKTKLFEAKKSNQKYFSIIMPPPNVTGHLHLGHAWDGTIQDCIIRYKKLNGYNAVWIPGLDHAGIATQTKFEKVLKDQNVDYKSILKKDFLTQLKHWADDQKQFIRDQWSQLGFAIANNVETYTMDQNVNELVNEIFIKMFNQKLIYRDYKLVNWDIKLKTAISDIEAIKKPTKSKMYYFKYFLEGSKNNYIEVATTRPETMFGDIAVFVNPKDKRYQKIHNKFLINPVNGNKLKVYLDDYVDPKFGTGAMKCTPGHDFHDYELAKKHNINNYHSIMNEDGTLNHLATNYQGIDRLKAREMIVNDLENQGYLIKIEDHDNEVAYSERTNEIVEPLLSNQWFLKMQPIVKKLELILKKNPTIFYPKRFFNNLKQWLKNINDWCISRQLWWGHQLPIYFERKSHDQYIAARKNPDPKKYVQSEDVLDTWFSSGLWPLACTKYGTSPIVKNIYPISILTTAYDILFFWVARMFFQCSYLDNSNPFKTILIHGLIRDEQNRKMSKSLNNGIEPKSLIEKHSADALRTFLISTSTLGDDLRFNEEKIIYYRNFINKLINIANFFEINNINKIFKIDNKNFELKNLSFVNAFFANSFIRSIKDISRNMDEYNFVIANKKIIDFIWNEFANTYLEIAKPIFYNKTHFLYEETLKTFNFIFINCLILLHPFMPFVTDFLYQKLYNTKDFIWNLSWPKFKWHQQQNLSATKIIEIINLCNKFQKENNITNKSHQIKIINQPSLNCSEIIDFLKLHNILITDFVKNPKLEKQEFLLVSKSVSIIYQLDLKNCQQIMDKYQKQISFYQDELKRSKNILNNQNFLKKAPAEKVAIEKQKLLDYQKKYDELVAFVKNFKTNN